MNHEFSPFYLLFAATLCTLASYRKAALILVAVAVIRALMLHIVDPVALAPLALLALIAWQFPAKPNGPAWRWAKIAAILAIALGLLAHFFPGFNNVKVLDAVQFTPDAVPFTMYFNFDKAMAGVLLLVFIVKPAQWEPFEPMDLKWVLISLTALVAVLVPAALLLGYVAFAPKALEKWWFFNNLVFVCVAEEVVFRGVLQSRLMLLRPGSDSWRWVSVGIAALAFGLAHFAGGPIYVLLATIAGCAYGFVYLKTRKIEAAILVHFLLNLIHFALFTYPALAS